MMLLDTHVLIWLAQGDRRIGPATLAGLGHADRRYFSAISVLEIRIKQLIGKIGAPADINAVARAVGLTPLGFDTAAADAILKFPELARHDPFDRALLGQALSSRLRFVTADESLLGLGLGWVLDARM